MFVGRIRGGLGFVATLTCAILGAISGSTFTGLAATGNMLIPEMVSRGYPRAFATALITCSSILGVLIPPSTPMIKMCIRDRLISTEPRDTFSCTTV